MSDPVEIGMRLAQPIMQQIYRFSQDPKLRNNPEELSKIGIMIDVLVGSAQVTAVEQGLEATVEEYRTHLSKKLKQLGL